MFPLYETPPPMFALSHHLPFPTVRPLIFSFSYPLFIPHCFPNFSFPPSLFLPLIGPLHLPKSPCFPNCHRSLFVLGSQQKCCCPFPVPYYAYMHNFSPNFPCYFVSLATQTSSFIQTNRGYIAPQRGARLSQDPNVAGPSVYILRFPCYISCQTFVLP